MDLLGIEVLKKMDNNKLLEAIEEDELMEIARKAENKMLRFYAQSSEAIRKDQFCEYLIDEFKRYFYEHVDFEPIVLHYMEKHWYDNHSDNAAQLSKADEEYERTK